MWLTVGLFTDNRGEPSDWLGAIRGGFGNPLKEIWSTEPVADLVAKMFTAGLQARGLTVQGSDASHLLTGSIIRLDCNQLVRPEANAEIELYLTERKNGQKVFSRTYRATNVEGSVFSPATGIFASVEKLRSLTEKTLQQVVDQALDDPAFHDAVSGFHKP